MELITKIKNICNTKSKNLNIIKDPIELYKEFGKDKSTNIFKGLLFELFLEELFSGNGYIVDPIGERGGDGGCDLIVKYPEDNSIRFIVQAKNWKKAIDKYDIIKEYSKFQNNYKQQNNLKNGHFCFIAWNYVKSIKHDLNTKLKINVWDEFDIINNLIETYDEHSPKKQSIFLESYQKEAFGKIINYWTENERCYVEHSTGTGKTFIIAKLVEEVLHISTNNKILILSPSLYINDRINNLLKTFIPIRSIALKYNKTVPVNILTYQYLFHNSSDIQSNHFTHIIMDEAHRAGALEWHNKGLLKVINPESKIVGLSATMQRFSSGINIKEFLGKNCAGKLSLFEAMAADILPTGKYVYSVVEMKSKVDEIKYEVVRKYKNYADKMDGLLNILDSKQIKEYSIQQIIFKHYSSKKYKKIIVFCEAFEHAIDTLALLEKVFVKFSKVKIKKITSKGSKKDNQNLLKWFSDAQPNANEIFIIVAIDMLNEGIDVSGIDSVMLFRKTESPRIYFQQIGRAIRKLGKDPLIFDCVLNFQNVNVQFVNEIQNEIDKYRKALNDFGFKDIDTPKSFSVIDETKGIKEIIKKVEDKLNFYRSYLKAQEAVQKLGIKSEAKYRIMYRKDPRLPSKPDKTYKNNGWTNWYDFFGTEIPNFYSTYFEAKNATYELGIKSHKMYKQRYKEDPKLPSHPDGTYKNNGWKNWYEYFSINRIAHYPTYEEAKNAVRKLGIKSNTAYKKYHYNDPRLPYSPQIIYKNKGWISFHEFLGISPAKKYQTYIEAKNAVLKLNIRSEKEYRLRYKEDDRLPSTPSRFYKDKGWIDNYDFFNKKRPDYYATYNEAIKAIRKLSIKSRKEYDKRYKDDQFLPSNPEDIYKGIGWIDYFNFLGIKRRSYYETYEEAQMVIKQIGIRSRKEYIEQKRYKEDSKLPSNPSKYYKAKGWTKWDEFFVKHYIKYEEAKDATKKLGIKSKAEYVKYKRYKEDLLLPSDPEKKYQKFLFLESVSVQTISISSFNCHQSKSFMESTLRSHISQFSLKSDNFWIA